jgi:hypothetical protein
MSTVAIDPQGYLWAWRCLAAGDGWAHHMRGLRIEHATAGVHDGNTLTAIARVEDPMLIMGRSP